MVHRVPDKVSLNGGCSSIGRAPDCGSGRCEFESHQSPALSLGVMAAQQVLILLVKVRILEGQQKFM